VRAKAERGVRCGDSEGRSPEHLFHSEPEHGREHRRPAGRRRPVRPLTVEGTPPTVNASRVAVPEVRVPSGEFSCVRRRPIRAPQGVQG
jgi:hypothetical protein